MVRVAERVPLAEGVKVTLKVQLAPAATELPHVLVSAKSDALAPEIATEVTVSAAPPVFVRVMLSAALLVPTAVPGKAGRVAGDRLTTGAVAVPVRVTAGTVSDPLPDPEPFLPVTVTVPVRVPLAVGLKVTLIVQ